MISSRRRRSDTDVELEKTFFFRVVRHGIGPDGFFLVHALVAPDIVLVPVFVELFLDVEILERNFIRRTLQLHVTASAEIHFLAFRQFQYQFLDEGGHVVVGDNLTFPLLHTEELFRHFDLHVLLHRNLAGQTPAFFFFAVGEVGLFRGQHGATAVQNLALALGTGTATATGRGQVDAAVGQSTQQLTARGGLERVLGVVVDLNGHVTGAYQLGAGCEDNRNQRQNDNGEHDHAENNFCIHGLAFSLNRITG